LTSLRVGRWRYKAGANDPHGKIMKATMVAMLEKLLADGALHAYQIDADVRFSIARFLCDESLFSFGLQI